MTELIYNKNIKRIILVLFALLAVISLLQGIRNGMRDSQDFQWDAAKVLALRINPYDESLSPTGILEQYDYDEYYLQMEANQFPSLLMILLPFTMLKPLTARYVWLVFNILLTGLMIYLLRKTFLKEMDNNDFAIIISLMIAGTPYRNQLGVGQHTIFAFTFFLLAVFLSEYCEFFDRNLNKNSLGRTVLVTVCLFICFFKYTLTVPLVLYFVYKKRYKEIVFAGLAHCILTQVAAMWLSDSFINMIIKPLKVSSALSSEGGIDFGVLFRGSNISYCLLMAVMVLMLIMAFRIKENHDKAYISVLVMWSVIVTYHRTYDFFVVILAVALFYDLPALVSCNKRLTELLKIMYIVMFVLVYFVLRVFSENAPSKVVAGIAYYALTVFVTYIVMKGYMFKRENNE